MANILTRTDTKEVPYSPIRNKYDKPQQNSRKIKWNDKKLEDKKLKDKKLMPPPTNIIKKSILKKSILKRGNSPYPKI
tara:strand:+ start:666 stop:899 length:234 start_codon:yes stop_codon:yes gene_type:complete